MADATEFLTRQVGPLPVWGWGVAIVGGLGVGYVIQRGFSSASSGEEPESGAKDPGGPTGDLQQTTGSVGLPGGPASRSETSGPQTNRQWRAAALTWALDNDHDPVKVEQALGRYLAGQKITAAGGDIVRGVLRNVGRPPEGAPTLKTGRGDGSADDSTDPADGQLVTDPSECPSGTVLRAGRCVPIEDSDGGSSDDGSSDDGSSSDGQQRQAAIPSDCPPGTTLRAGLCVPD